MSSRKQKIPVAESSEHGKSTKETSNEGRGRGLLVGVGTGSLNGGGAVVGSGGRDGGSGDRGGDDDGGRRQGLRGVDDVAGRDDNGGVTGDSLAVSDGNSRNVIDLLRDGDRDDLSHVVNIGDSLGDTVQYVRVGHKQKNGVGSLRVGLGDLDSLTLDDSGVGGLGAGDSLVDISSLILGDQGRGVDSLGLGNLGDNGRSRGPGDLDGGAIDNSGLGDRAELSEGGNNDSSVGLGHWRSSLGNNNLGGSNLDDGGSGGPGHLDSRAIDDSGLSDRAEGSEGGVDDLIGSLGHGRASLGNHNCCGLDGLDGAGGGVGGGVCVTRLGVGLGDGADGSVGYDNLGDHGLPLLTAGDVGAKGGGREGEEGKSCSHVD